MNWNKDVGIVEVERALENVNSRRSTSVPVSPVGVRFHRVKQAMRIIAVSERKLKEAYADWYLAAEDAVLNIMLLLLQLGRTVRTLVILGGESIGLLTALLLDVKASISLMRAAYF